MNCYGVSGFLVISKSYLNSLLQQQDRKQINQTKEYFIDWPELSCLTYERLLLLANSSHGSIILAKLLLFYVCMMLSKLNIGCILILSVCDLTADAITRP